MIAFLFLRGGENTGAEGLFEPTESERPVAGECKMPPFGVLPTTPPSSRAILVGGHDASTRRRAKLLAAKISADVTSGCASPLGVTFSFFFFFFVIVQERLLLVFFFFFTETHEDQTGPRTAAWSVDPAEDTKGEQRQWERMAADNPVSHPFLRCFL